MNFILLTKLACWPLLCWHIIIFLASIHWLNSGDPTVDLVGQTKTLLKSAYISFLLASILYCLPK